MNTRALYVTLGAKPGKEAELESFLTSALALVAAEPATTIWFALKTGPSTFAIFDAFPDERGLDAHLAGAVAEALFAKAPELLAGPPSIERLDVLAEKTAARNPVTADVAGLT